jgi:dTDP-glucose 4,6-dehydratase
MEHRQKKRLTILITGGAGFLGSHLCRRLLLEGHRVICVDNFITGSRKNIAEFKKNKYFSLIRHDISKPLHVDEKIDWVLHFASPASPKDYLAHPIKTLKVGLLGTHNCLGITKEKQCKFLLASTSEVYGDPLISPQPEEYWGNVNPNGIRSCYDEAKRAAEALTFAYKRQHGLNTRVIRIFNTYGPAMRLDDGRVVSNFIYQALTGKPITIYGKGAQTRSFCYVDDLIEGIIRYMNIDYPGPINLGNAGEFTIIELARIIIALTGSVSRICFEDEMQDDPKQRRPDLTKARNLLKWKASVKLETGLRRTIECFKSQLR